MGRARLRAPDPLAADGARCSDSSPPTSAARPGTSTPWPAFSPPFPRSSRPGRLLAQDQYLEVRTLLSGYLLSSQGDRMLMAHSVEGRFPFLDPGVVELANSLPAAFKLRVLDEKHVLKKAAAGLVPDEVIRRPKQPYRAPGRALLRGSGLARVDSATFSPNARWRRPGSSSPDAVARLWKKCQATGGGEQFSNADNMALVGVLSTGLLHERLVRARPWPGPARRLQDSGGPGAAARGGSGTWIVGRSRGA